MSVEALLSAIEREGRREAERILAAAREEAERLDREADERLERRRRASTSAHEAEARARAEAEVAVVRRAVREEVLEARRALLERAFGAALSPALRPEALAAVRAELGEDLARALACLDPAGAVISCAPALAEAVGEAVGAAPGVRAPEIRVDAGLEAGLRLASEGGRVEVDLGLASRVEAARPRAAVAALRAFDDAQEAGT